MTRPDNRLLILSCSKKKRSTLDEIPALERYDGPSFQVLRNFLVTYPIETNTLDIYIISARYGLISATQPINDYDQFMTIERADELKWQILTSFKSLLEKRLYGELFVNVGKNYLQAMTGYEQMIPSRLKIITASGTSGRRQGQLWDWLRSRIVSESSQETLTRQGRATLKGIELKCTKEDIIKLVRQALINNPAGAASYQNWYVQIDHQRVAPKWLISQLTGLPVASFHSGDARRVLRQLGVQVCKE